jgi:hypothetical protein
MRAKRLSIPVALAVVALGAVPGASARSSVTLPSGVLAALHAHATVSQAVNRSGKRKVRSCQAGDDRSRIRLPGPTVATETERRAATLACEQPPKSGLNLNDGLKNAQAAAMIAAG